MYGHSAGAQFVHRFTEFMPRGTHMLRAVAANSGWYTLPTLEGDAAFPYSFKKAPVNRRKAQLKLALGRRLIVLLGQKDEGSKHLRRTKDAMAQGENRFTRGINFFTTAYAAAAELNVPFHWSLQTVPLVGHVNRRMALAASRLLFAEV